jgi:sugar O-acyltransferase (sialic acid O-acetyltransferase NeuD family)
MKKVVIFGTTEIAKLACFYFRDDSEYEVVAFTVDRRYRESETLLGLPVVAAETLTDTHPPAAFAMFVGISYSSANRSRAAVYVRFKQLGYHFATYVNSHSSVLTKDLGENVLVMDNVTIQASTKVGNDVIFAPNAMVCHDCEVHDHVYVGPGACLCGYNVVGEYSVIGACAVIAPRVHLGKENLIGVGARILSSTGDDEAYLTSATPKSKMAASRALRVELFRRPTRR